MTAQEFLKSELQSLADKFPNVKIKYGFNTLIEAHIVELLPLIEYNTNTALDDAWISISLEFNETFSNEEVVFISSDSTLSLKDVIFELNSFACTEENIITELFATLTEKEVSYTFSTLFVNGKVTNTSFVNFKDHPTENENNIHSEDSYLAAA